MTSIAEGLARFARDRGAVIRFSAPATRIVTERGRVKALATPEGEVPADAVVVNADCAHAELDLLSGADRSCGAAYWNKAVVSKTDPGVAPAGAENISLLVPVAPGLEDTDEAREALFSRAMAKLEALRGTALGSPIRWARPPCSGHPAGPGA
jgi:phytoene desaturase